MSRPRIDFSRMLDHVLGINRRNLEYVYRKNLRKDFHRVDDKIEAKELLRQADLPFVDTLAAIDTRTEVRRFLDRVPADSAFVVKPARGFGGTGVMVHKQYQPERDREDVSFQMAAILSGMYALDSLTDRVLVEELVVEDPLLTDVHGGHGVSDLRLLCSDGHAIMAMLRLPCAESAPTANLHQGGVGVGVDMTSGRTTFAVHHGKPIATHPDTGKALGGMPISHWERILDFGTRLNACFGLGYLGGDIVIDRARGPVFLEVNARPGLAIQLANRRGLRGPLETAAMPDEPDEP